jgi:hypothetical protein
MISGESIDASKKLKKNEPLPQSIPDTQIDLLVQT